MNAGVKPTILNYLTLLVMVLVSEGFVIGDEFITAEEVVSIYGPNLITPESRTPYYIKIRRCIINEDVFFTSNPQCWSVPKENSRQEIEIVVPDINDNSMFYKYVVYNDTACKCMTRNNGAFDIAQHKHLESHEVDESEFKTKLTNNAENLLSCHRSFCSNPQPRYTINRLGDSAKPENKYILHHQCLPGCSRTTRATMISDDKFEEISGTRRKSDVVNHLECSPHTPSGRGKSGALRNVPTLSHDSIEEAPDKTTLHNGKLIYIASTKLLLVAFVLSMMISSILIVDCNLFHRKKGILYSISCWAKSKKGCPNCAETAIKNRIEV